MNLRLIPFTTWVKAQPAFLLTNSQFVNKLFISSPHVDVSIILQIGKAQKFFQSVTISINL